MILDAPKVVSTCPKVTSSTLLLGIHDSCKTTAGHLTVGIQTNLSNFFFRQILFCAKWSRSCEVGGKCNSEVVPY